MKYALKHSRQEFGTDICCLEGFLPKTRESNNYSQN